MRVLGLRLMILGLNAFCGRATSRTSAITEGHFFSTWTLNPKPFICMTTCILVLCRRLNAKPEP